MWRPVTGICGGEGKGLPEDPDVLVVGAGPGGLAAGREAARAGARVLVVDRKERVGEPVRCAEGTLERWVEMQGLPDGGPHVARQLNCISFFSPSGRRVDFTSRLRLTILNRDLFETALARQCIGAGATVAMDTALVAMQKKPPHAVGKVKLTGLAGDRKGGSFTVNPKVVIAADGVDSPTGRLAGMVGPVAPSDMGSCWQFVVRAPGSFETHAAQFHFGAKEFPGGYGWLFPKSESAANVGVMIDGRRGGDARRILEGFGRRLFPGGRPEVMRSYGACVPLALPPERTCAGNVLLAGDAARMTNPIAGAGIANALVSGSVAGGLAAEAASSGRSPRDVLDALGRYDDLWRPRIENSLLRGKSMKRRYLGDEQSIERFFRLLPPAAFMVRRFPGLTERLLMSRVGL